MLVMTLGETPAPHCGAELFLAVAWISQCEMSREGEQRRRVAPGGGRAPATLLQLGLTGEAGAISVAHLEGWRIFRSRLAPVVDTRGTDVGMAQPLLDLGDIGLVF